MERRFNCTVCGKCCIGWLPLTLGDALINAGRFPLAMVLTTVRQGAKAYDLTARIGTVVARGKHKRVAVQVSPMSYIPPSLACPALSPDGKCSIHADKPTRCRTMPFSAYREERDQTSLLVPKKEWECDTSNSAPAVYRDREITDRAEFDRERRHLLDQAASLRAYADTLIANAPNVAEGIERASSKASGGYVVLNFTTLLPHLQGANTAEFARSQLPVLEEFACRTEGMAKCEEYHRYYRDNAESLRRVLKR